MTVRRPPRTLPPLDAGALDRLALAYVGRFATSRARLARYLTRKIAERGWADATPPDAAAIANRMAGLGYIDDAGLAEARGRSMARSGHGARRVSAALDALGISRGDAAETVALAAEEGWDRALRFAERRRIGPFASSVPDERGRRRAFAAMMRAGHRPEHASKIIAAEPGSVPVWGE